MQIRLLRKEILIFNCSVLIIVWYRVRTLILNNSEDRLLPEVTVDVNHSPCTGLQVAMLLSIFLTNGVREKVLIQIGRKQQLYTTFAR